MSDSNGPSSFGFLNNWKIGLAVCVPCFAVGVGVTYYYYSKSLGMAPPLNEPAVVGVPPETNEIVVQNQIDNKVRTPLAPIMCNPDQGHKRMERVEGSQTQGFPAFAHDLD